MDTKYKHFQPIVKWEMMRQVRYMWARSERSDVHEHHALTTCIVTVASHVSTTHERCLASGHESEHKATSCNWSGSHMKVDELITFW